MAISHLRGEYECDKKPKCNLDSNLDSPSLKPVAMQGNGLFWQILTQHPTNYTGINIPESKQTLGWRMCSITEKLTRFSFSKSPEIGIKGFDLKWLDGSRPNCVYASAPICKIFSHDFLWSSCDVLRSFHAPDTLVRTKLRPWLLMSIYTLSIWLSQFSRPL